MKRIGPLITAFVLTAIAVLASLPAQSEPSAALVPLDDEYALRGLVGRSLRIRTEGGGDFRGNPFSYGFGGSGWSFILGSDVFIPIPIPVVSFTYRIR